MNNVLKPCPFCGGEARVRTTTTQDTPSSPMAFVCCKKCQSTATAFVDYKNDGSFLFDAIDARNRRAGEEDKIMEE